MKLLVQVLTVLLLQRNETMPEYLPSPPPCDFFWSCVVQNNIVKPPLINKSTLTGLEIKKNYLVAIWRLNGKK